MSTTTKAVLLLLFVLLLAGGMIAGLVRDFASKDKAILGGVVTSVTLAGNDYKSPTPRLTRADIRLDDGRDIFVTSGSTLLRGLDKGTRVKVAERRTPWGQTWYAVVEPKPPAEDTAATPVTKH